jgi:uncharacterized protein with PQ loop repeat
VTGARAQPYPIRQFGDGEASFGLEFSKDLPVDGVHAHDSSMSEAEGERSWRILALLQTYPCRRSSETKVSTMDLLDWLPVAAAVFAVPQFLPQLVAVWRTSDVTGVSWSWAALTSISNGAWIVYFAAAHLWTALVPAIAATVLAGVLAVLIARHAAVKRSAVAIAAGWTGLLGITGFAAGPVGLGTLLTASFVLQVTPSVWAAYRTRRPTGIARGTWLLILAELLCWGVFGLHIGDPRLTVLGWTGVAASVLVLIRVPRRRLAYASSSESRS